MAATRGGVFFDFDNTLICGDSQDLEIRWLFRQRRLPIGFMLRVAAAVWFYRRGALSSNDAVRLCLTHYRGRRLADVERDAERFFREVVTERFFDKTLDEMARHRAAGRPFFILSASPRHLIEPAARFLGAADCRCTKLEIGPGGLLTGLVDGLVMHGEEKAVAVRQLARKHRLSLRESFAYSDHEADIAFLEAVGHPTAVRPTKKLTAYAKLKNWSIIN
jgi:HAD superfamily hydrolase (TIGR01490 family)